MSCAGKDPPEVNKSKHIPSGCPSFFSRYFNRRALALNLSKTEHLWTRSGSTFFNIPNTIIYHHMPVWEYVGKCWYPVAQKPIKNAYSPPQLCR